MHDLLIRATKINSRRSNWRKWRLNLDFLQSFVASDWTGIRTSKMCSTLYTMPNWRGRRWPQRANIHFDSFASELASFVSSFVSSFVIVSCHWDTKPEACRATEISIHFLCTRHIIFHIMLLSWWEILAPSCIAVALPGSLIPADCYISSTWNA